MRSGSRPGSLRYLERRFVRVLPTLHTMKTRTKVYVDRLAGLPLAWLLNIAARILGKLLRRDHSVTTENVRTIVISKYVGMGSIIQATPLIRSIQATFPQARLIFVTGQSCRRMVERLDHVDRIITVDDRGLFPVIRTSICTLAELIWSRPDLYFDLEALLGLLLRHVALKFIAESHRVLS